MYETNHFRISYHIRLYVDETSFFSMKMAKNYGRNMSEQYLITNTNIVSRITSLLEFSQMHSKKMETFPNISVCLPNMILTSDLKPYFSRSYLFILVLKMPVTLTITNTVVRGKVYRQSQNEIITSYQPAILSSLNGHSLK
jgi:hypothetical protein